MKYDFNYGWSKKPHKKFGDMASVTLKDDTQIIVMSKRGIFVKYPTKKFAKIFNEQIKNKHEYLTLSYSPTETKAVILGLLFGMSNNKKSWLKYWEDLTENINYNPKSKKR